MKRNRFVLCALFAALLLVLTGCAAENNVGEATPSASPTPGPTFAMPELPANTEEALVQYDSLSLDEQLACHSIGRLVHLAAEDNPGTDYYETIRTYITSYMASGGVTLPEGFTVSQDGGTELYLEGDTQGESAPSAKFYITNFNSPEGGESVIASVIELESDYLAGDDFPRYIARTVLTPQSPKSTENFLFDADGDGSLDYAFRFYVPNTEYDQSQSECYIIHLKDWRFEMQSVTPETWAEAKKGYEHYCAVYAMRENVKKGVNLLAQSFEHPSVLLTPYKGSGSRGTYTVNDLYEVQGETGTFTVKYLYEGGVSTWQLSLALSEQTLEGGFSAGAADAAMYETGLLCVDLTEDGKEEIILSVMPQGATTGGELHVFSERDGVLKEILTVCDGNPEQKQAQYKDSYFVIPDGYVHKDGVSVFGLNNVYTRATCISTSGLKVLRITAERGSTTAQTYLWWNGEAFEIVYQAAF